MSTDNTKPCTSFTQSSVKLAAQAAELHKQIKDLSDMHKHYYRAAECYFALAQELPEKPRDLSLYSEYLQDCMFDVVAMVQDLMC